MGDLSARGTPPPPMHTQLHKIIKPKLDLPVRESISSSWSPDRQTDMLQPTWQTERTSKHIYTRTKTKYKTLVTHKLTEVIEGVSRRDVTADRMWNSPLLRREVGGKSYDCYRCRWHRLVKPSLVIRLAIGSLTAASFDITCRHQWRWPPKLKTSTTCSKRIWSGKRSCIYCRPITWKFMTFDNPTPHFLRPTTRII